MSTTHRLKQILGMGRVVDRPYRCQGCGQRFEVQYYCCPECESFSVEREHP